MKPTALKKYTYPWPLRLVSGLLLTVQAVIAVDAQQVIFEKLNTPAKRVTLEVPATPDWQPPASPRKAMVHLPDSIVFGHTQKICSYCKKKIQTNKNSRKYGI